MFWLWNSSSYDTVCCTGPHSRPQWIWAFLSHYHKETLLVIVIMCTCPWAAAGKFTGQCCAVGGALLFSLLFLDVKEERRSPNELAQGNVSLSSQLWNARNFNREEMCFSIFVTTEMKLMQVIPILFWTFNSGRQKPEKKTSPIEVSNSKPDLLSWVCKGASESFVFDYENNNSQLHRCFSSHLL